MGVVLLCYLRTGHILYSSYTLLGVIWVKVVCQHDRWEPCCLTAQCVCNWEAGISFVCTLYIYVPRSIVVCQLVVFFPRRQPGEMLSVNLTYNDRNIYETVILTVNLTYK
jgi:hypothetical protein